MTENRYFGRTSVALMVFLTIITCGLYVPIWFLLTRKDLNQLETTARVRPESIGLLILFVVGAIAANIIGGWGASENMAATLRLFGSVLNVCYTVTVIVLAFKVRGVLDEHFNQRLGLAVPFSAVATFFLTIFYLQYKMNRLPLATQVGSVAHSTGGIMPPS